MLYGVVAAVNGPERQPICEPGSTGTARSRRRGPTRTISAWTGAPARVILPTKWRPTGNRHVSTLDRPIRARLSRPLVAFMLALAVAVVGGGLALVNRTPGVPVALLTIDAADPMNGACFLSFIEGELVTDPVSGTAIIGRNGGEPDRFPVMWPAGWTGRRTVLSEVEVLDPTGKVAARTGTRVHLAGGVRSNAWLACYDVFPL